MAVTRLTRTCADVLLHLQLPPVRTYIKGNCFCIHDTWFKYQYRILVHKDTTVDSLEH